MKRPQNATERLAIRSAFIPKGARPILEHENGSALYVYDSGALLYAVAFWGTAAKPLWHYRYPTEERRTDAILRFKESVEHSVTFRASQRAARIAQPCTLKAGDIVNTSWGYDQTNVSFYVVTHVSGKRVYIRPIASDYEATASMAGRCWPRVPLTMTGPETWCMGRGTNCLIDGHSASITTGDCYTSSYA